MTASSVKTKNAFSRLLPRARAPSSNTASGLKLPTTWGMIWLKNPLKASPPLMPSEKPMTSLASHAYLREYRK